VSRQPLLTGLRYRLQWNRDGSAVRSCDLTPVSTVVCVQCEQWSVVTLWGNGTERGERQNSYARLHL